MKTTENQGICSILSLVMAAALSGMGLVTDASAQVQPHSYLIDLNTRTAVDLGNVRGTAINDTGQVVGQSYVTDHGFITGPNGVGMKDLGLLTPIAVNNAGQVAGDYHSPEGFSRSFITGPNGVGMTDLGMLPGGIVSSVTDINNAGQVVGSVCCFSPMGGGIAFIAGPNGGSMTRVAEGPGASYADGINDMGQVVGHVETDYRRFQGFITGPNGVGTTVFDNWDAVHGINNAGQVVGESYTAAGSHAFITGPDGEGMRDLGSLGGGKSYASGINDAGQVVGWSDTATGSTHAFITAPEGVRMADLNSLVDMPSGVVLLQATTINNAGQVLAIGLIPEPETYALMLAGLVLAGVMVRHKQKADVLEGVSYPA